MRTSHTSPYIRLRTYSSPSWPNQLKSQLRLRVKAGMYRAFAIAPTASCSYNNVDLRGYTTTPELAPPISRHVDRDSGTFGVQSYAYPPDCEIAAEVGWADYKRVVDGMVTRCFRSTMLFHGYSFNSWSDMSLPMTVQFIRDWMAYFVRPLSTMPFR
jgi:hypothetical protein